MGGRQPGGDDFGHPGVPDSRHFNFFRNLPPGAFQILNRADGNGIGCAEESVNFRRAFQQRPRRVVAGFNRKFTGFHPLLRHGDTAALTGFQKTNAPLAADRAVLLRHADHPGVLPAGGEQQMGQLPCGGTVIMVNARKVTGALADHHNRDVHA